MRESDTPPGPPRNAELARRELEGCADEIYRCYENGMSVKETLSHLHATSGIPPGGLSDPRDERLYLEAIQEILAFAAGRNRKGVELQSFFNLFEPTRTSPQHRLAVFNTVFRNRLEHVLTWLPRRGRAALEKLIGRPLREREEYTSPPPQRPPNGSI